MATINGTAGDDTIAPGNNSAGNNNLEDDDIINGFAGDDDIDAGKGDDLVNAGPGDDVVTGGEDKDTINGGEDDDQLFGGKGDDIINGGTGDDILVGGADKDSLFGGDGNDILDGVDNKQEDILDGGAGIDFVDYRDAKGRQKIYFDDADKSEGERSKDTWISIEGVMGSTKSKNDIYGADTDDRIIGGNKKDKLYGRDGMDVLEGRLGKDQLFGGDGFDILNGGRGSDKLTGGADTDIFYFEAGEMDGDDQILDFELGTDLVFLEKTGVTLEQVGQIIASNSLTNPNGDIVYTDPAEGGTITFKGVSYNALTAFLDNGGALASVFYVGASASGSQSGIPIEPAMPEIIRGTRRADTLEGTDGVDFLSGRGGRDVLLGGDGGDFLNGGRGRDILTGGEGADWFVFGRRDVITDFSVEDGDTILFRASRDLDFDDLNIRQVGSDTLISVGRAKMRLEDFSDTLTEDSFNFAYVRGETELDLI
ncbi:MAG: calcium-binding protein [Pseudomonadota bacterium]